MASAPACAQVAFADRLLLNKTDLLKENEAELAMVEGRLREINKYAPILRCQNSAVGLENVLGLKAFELQRVLEMDPDVRACACACRAHSRWRLSMRALSKAHAHASCARACARLRMPTHALTQMHARMAHVLTRVRGV